MGGDLESRSRSLGSQVHSICISNVDFEEELWDLSQLSVFYFECLLKNGVLSRIGESS